MARGQHDWPMTEQGQGGEGIKSEVKKETKDGKERGIYRRRQNEDRGWNSEELWMEGKEKKMVGGEGFMDTGTGRSVGIGLSVLWYRVIVQRKHTEWFFT